MAQPQLRRTVTINYHQLINYQLRLQIDVSF